MEHDFWNTIKTIANAQGVDQGTYRMWKSRGAVPSKHHYDFVLKAKELELPLTYELLSIAQ